jgi:hypothetical protein
LDLPAGKLSAEAALAKRAAKATPQRNLVSILFSFMDKSQWIQPGHDIRIYLNRGREGVFILGPDHWKNISRPVHQLLREFRP